MEKRTSINKYYDNVQRETRKKHKCIHLLQKSELIKNLADIKESHIDTYSLCLRRDKRISKRACINCVMYQITKK